jgi:PAS domain S-box-containing protein
MPKEDKNTSNLVWGSEGEYSKLFYNNTAVMLLIDPLSGNILDANNAASEFYGYSHNELTSMKIQDINVLSDEQVLAEMERAKKMEQNHFLFEHRLANGIIRNVDVYSEGITIKDQHLLFSIIHDITERKRAEEDSYRSKNQLKFYMDNSPMAIVECDSDFIVTRWTGASKKIFGWKAEEVMGKNIMGLKLIYEPDIPLVEEATKKITSGIFQQVYSCNRNYKKDGSIMTCEWYNIVLNDENGKMQSVLSNIIDITDRKRIEEESLKQKEILQRIIDNIPVMITYFDKNGNINMVNKELVRVLGWTLHEWETENIFTKCYPEPDYAKEVADFMNSEDNGWKDCNTKTKYGTTIDTSWTNVRISDGALMGIGQDITERKKAEEKLRDSEDLYRRLFNEDLAGNFVSTINGQLLQCNPAYAAILGFESVDEMLKAKTQSFYKNPDDRNIIIKGIKENKKLINYEYKLITKDGKEIDAIANIFGKFDNKGNLIQLSGYMIDITKLKQAELELIRAKEIAEANEEQFRNLFENSPIGKSMTGIDGSMHVNKSFCEIVGYSEEELLNRKWTEITYPEDISLTNEKTQSLLTGEAEKVFFEKRFIHKSGNIVWTDVSTYLQRNNENKPEYFITTVIDVTQRKQSESKLKGLSTIVEHSLNEIYVFSQEDLRFVYVNLGALNNIGFSKDEMLTMTPLDIKPEITPDAFLKIINPLLTHEQDIINFETIHQRKNNSTYPVDIYLQISEFEGKQVFVAVIIDITERKTYESELIAAKEKAEESDRLKSAFLANMSHEIRTPMNGILGFTELLKEPTLTIEEQQDFIQTIEISGARMLNTINNIVDVSKIESGLVKVDVKETDINEKMLFIYKFFRQEIEKKGLQFLYKNGLPTKEATIKTDNEKVYGILTNLIKNAIKFTDKGSIEFGYEKKGEYIEFFVNDTGTGINEKQKEFIFDRFRQGSDELTRKYEGSGLGLSIAKSYIEMLGGKIWVESQEGIGTTFYFTIPYISESVVETEKISAASAEYKEGQLKNLKILIVEDDEVSYSLLSRVVQKISKEVLHAMTGVEAVEFCHKNPDLDLILMDIRMPKMDGLEATRQIRQFNKDLIIIAQTAYGFSSDCERALGAGCNDYISKPINSNTLFSLLNKYFV